MQERLDVFDVFHRTHEAQPEVIHLHFLITCWGAMTYSYVSGVIDGVRRLMRILPDNVRKTEYRHKALAPEPQGRPRWGFPTTWLMGHHTCYWKSIAIPKVGRKISKSARTAVLHEPVRNLRDEDEREDPLTNLKSPPEVYPPGNPLLPSEIKASRIHLQRPQGNGAHLRRGFPDPLWMSKSRSYMRTRKA